MINPLVCQRRALGYVRGREMFLCSAVLTAGILLTFYAVSISAGELDAIHPILEGPEPLADGQSPVMQLGGSRPLPKREQFSPTSTIDVLGVVGVDDNVASGDSVRAIDLQWPGIESTPALAQGPVTCLSTAGLRTMTQPRAGEAFSALITTSEPCASELALDSISLEVDGIRYFGDTLGHVSGVEQKTTVVEFVDLMLPAGMHQLRVDFHTGDSLVTEILVEDAMSTLEIFGLVSEVSDTGLEPVSPPIPGATLGLHIGQPDYWPGSVTALYATENATYRFEAEIDWAATEQLAGVGMVVRIQLPLGIPPGHGHLRIGLDERRTDWLAFDIADPAYVDQRANLADDLLTDLLASRDPISEPALTGPWNPLPQGARVTDGWSGDVLYETDSTGSFLFYSTDRSPLPAQSMARWHLLGGNGDRLAEGPIGDGALDVYAPDGELLLAGDGLGALYQDTGRAPSGDNSRNPSGLDDDPTQPSEDGDWTADDTAFSGRIDLTACPCGIRKIAVILQLDDTLVESTPLNKNEGKSKGAAVDAFRIKRKRTRKMFEGRGFDEIHEITPAQLLGPVPDYRIDRDKLKVKSHLRSAELTAYFALITDILFGIEHANEEACTELVVATLSHGQTRSPSDVERKRDPKTGKKVPTDAHLLLYQHGDNKDPAKDTVVTYTLVRDTVEVFHDFENSETPITFLINACHSQKPFSAIEKEVKRIKIHPDVLLVASSGGSQKTRSVCFAPGNYRTPFINAFNEITGPLSDSKSWRRFEKKVGRASRVPKVDVGGGTTIIRQRPHLRSIPKSGK